MEKYQNRKAAGIALGQELLEFANRKDVIVLALPRGGVPVAFEIADMLHVPLDVFIVRKLGVPGHVELAMGAIAMGDATVFNQDIIRQLNINSDEIQAVIEQEKKELNRRELSYRGEREPLNIQNKVVILVDDGIATGATIRAAIKAIRQQHPNQLIVAVPVADNSICHEIASLADRLVCPLRPADLYAVGLWYADFSQTEDAEVYALLEQARQFLSEKDAK